MNFLRLIYVKILMETLERALADKSTKDTR